MLQTQLSTNPYGLPHPDLRPHQAETIESLLALSGVAVINAPTGSGKTSFAAGVASRQHVIALVKTKNLQSANYGGSYDFDVLFGRSNYDCVHPNAASYASAAECMYTGAMNDCEHAGECPYLQAKRAASFSNRVSLNYSYWLAAGWPAEELAESGGYLFCDEAHQLSDVVLDHTSVTVTMAERLDWDLPAFPVVRGRAAAADVESCSAWLGAAERRLRAAARAMAPQGERGDEDEREEGEAKADPIPEMVLRRLRKCRSLIAKLQAVRDALETNSNDWFIRSGPAARDTMSGREPAFIARPLTARFHFPRYFLNFMWRTVMMSATIGDPVTFGEELGLGKMGTAWQYLDIPNAWAPEARPVQVLAAPAMGFSTRENESVLNEQARVIAKAILECPSDWTGLIHVTRKTEAVALAARLARHGIPSWRLWTPNPTHGTEKMMTEWQREKRRTAGALAVTWAWHEGYDGVDDKICIAAKAPFPSLGDEYERERMQYSGAMFLQRTAWTLEQMCGRSRRGNPKDYDTPGERRGLVAIADQNWRRVQKYLSAGFREALVEVK
jgi:Rad3-related DNA helicase